MKERLVGVEGKFRGYFRRGLLFCVVFSVVFSVDVGFFDSGDWVGGRTGI